MEDNSPNLERGYLRFLGAVAIYLPLLLLADTSGLLPQLALGAATAAFLVAFAKRGKTDSRQIIAAIVVATIGECILSLGWGLYSYQHALIPLYVPFGHGVFYALAAESARQPALKRIAPMITRGVLAAGSAIAIVSLVFFRDQWGLLWWLIAATLLVRSRNQLLLSTCFIFTMLLEWLGTAIGNWQWAAEVPFVGLQSANPPSGVGVLYILLDLVTVAICSNLQSAHATALRPAAALASHSRCGRLHPHHLGCGEREADDGDLPLRRGVPLPDRSSGWTRIQSRRARSW